MIMPSCKGFGIPDIDIEDGDHGMDESNEREEEEWAPHGSKTVRVSHSLELLTCPQVYQQLNTISDVYAGSPRQAATSTSQ